MTLPQYADHYRTSLRTVNRMKAAGIDLSDPVAVAVHLVSLPQDAIEPLERVAGLLEAAGSPPQLQS